MYSSTLQLPVPATVRPIRMLGGGAAGSREGGSGGYGRTPDGHRRRSAACASPASYAAGASPGNGCSPTGAGLRYSPSVATTTPAASSPNGPAPSISSIGPTPLSSPSPQPTSRPTITIFTDLQEEEEEEDYLQNSGRAPYAALTARAEQAWMSESGGAGGSATPPTTAEERQQRQKALAVTTTQLSPMHYRYLCNQTTTDNNEEEATPTSVAGFSPQLVRTETQTPHMMQDGYSFSATQPHGNNTDFAQSPTASFTGWPAVSTPPTELAPTRLSATPVVPIVPYVAEPSCRRRVAEDMERLYGPNGTAKSPGVSEPSFPVSTTGAGTPNSNAIPATTTTNTCASVSPSTAASTPTTTQPPAKKKVGLSLLSSSSSNKKAKAAAEAKRKETAASPVSAAAVRRNAREQVIRVGVQRLYQRLNELHLVVHHVKNDGNCQFRAISHQLFGNEDCHDIIRSQVVSYMRANRAESFDFFFESPAQADAYYDNLAKASSWGDELSLRAASDCLYVNIHVLSSEEKHCYITYRPTSDHAASAPSFLIDVMKLRERRRAERRLLRAHGLHGLRGTSSFAGSFDPLHEEPRGMTRNSTGVGGECSGGDYGGFGASTMPDPSARSRFSTARSGGFSNKGSPLLVPGALRTGPAPASVATNSRWGAQPAINSASSSAVWARPMSRDSSGAFYEEDGIEDEVEDDKDFDANAIQLALHKKLQQSEIRCSLPTGAMNANSFGFQSPPPNGSSHGVAASMPLLQPQRGAALAGAAPSLPSATTATGGRGGVHCNAHSTLLHPEGVPRPILLSGDEDVTKGAKANQVERFRAVGAEVQPLDGATQTVNIFTQQIMPVSNQSGTDDYVCFRPFNGQEEEAPAAGAGGKEQQQPASTPAETEEQAASTSLLPKSLFSDRRPAPLLAPTLQTPSTAVPSSDMSNASAILASSTISPARPFEDPGEMMLLASSSHRGRLSQTLQHSFSCMQGSSSYNGMSGGGGGMPPRADSFTMNALPGSYSPSFGGGGGGAGCAPSLGSFVPVTAAATGGDGGSTSTLEECRNGPALRCFRFEPRTEPIDIFLSYLFPVHYNSLSVAEPSEGKKTPEADGAVEKSGEAAGGPPTPNPQVRPALTPPAMSGGSMTGARY